MNNRNLFRGGLMLAAGLLPSVAGHSADRQSSPNFVFFMAEDLTSQSFAMFNGGNGALTPNLERMAEHGVTFVNAYSNAPVSSAAWSTLITGMYAPSWGLSWHRKHVPVALPEDIRLFPWYLREAGYYTCNASKTDYNCVMDKGAWDSVKGNMGDWRKRLEEGSENTPFFHCFTSTTSHESSLQFQEGDVRTAGTQYDPADVVLRPYHPDTETFRYTYARHYDRIADIDRELGRMIAMLEEDGLLDDTFIFFMGDNGGCLPFSKGYTGEAGLNVPLVVYVPENWKDLAPFSYGERAGYFVDFLDLAPTLLNLAGVDLPAHLDGEPFMGTGVSARDLRKKDEVYCYGDRFDELYAMNRTVRKGNLKYSRNFFPHHSKSLFCSYRYRQAAFREWKELYDAGRLNDIQSAFFLPQGPEELYDLSSDPYETVNLAADPRYSGKLEEMRTLLQRNMLDKKDLGLVPEYVWVEHCDDIASFRESLDESRFGEWLATADLQCLPFKKAEPGLKKALASGDAISRYWALVTCCGFGKDAVSLSDEVSPLLEDEDPVVRMQAASFLAMTKGKNPGPVLKSALAEAANQSAALMILNEAAFLHEYNPAWDLSVKKSDVLNFPKSGSERLSFLDKDLAHAQVSEKPEVRVFSMPLEYVCDPGSNGIVLPEEKIDNGAYRNVTKAEMTVYLPESSRPVPCILLFPGGGYDNVQVANAGTKAAEYLTAHGIAAVVVKYRQPNGHRMIPIMDGQQAIRMVRRSASEWNIIPDRIGICGSSAGGHLVSMLAVHTEPARPDSPRELEHYTSRPDFLILLKAAICWSKGNTMRNIHGPEPSEETVFYCNALNHITADHMPTFIAHCYDDPAAPSKYTVQYFLKLQELGIPAELHVYESGGHGIGWSPKNSRPMDSWKDALLKWRYLWPE